MCSGVTATLGIKRFKEEEVSYSLGGIGSSFPPEYSLRHREVAGRGGETSSPASPCTFRRKGKDKDKALKGQFALLPVAHTLLPASCPVLACSLR